MKVVPSKLEHVQIQACIIIAKNTLKGHLRKNMQKKYLTHMFTQQILVVIHYHACIYFILVSPL